LGPGMDGTGKYGKFFVREWTVREVREFPYRTVRKISRTVATLIMSENETDERHRHYKCRKRP
jgi:hypothetical protein